jgi:cytosine/adenosine deaminase-related metal-dependent hydrolase/SAM-dependent methyltransferase
MSCRSATPYLTPSEGYRLWSQSYDRDPNPMLSLEQRFLKRLLPPMTGLDIVDIGCGTGRWLEALKNRGAKSLVGIDLSPEMLDHARAKLGNTATLLCADYANALIAKGSADIVFANFVLSYVHDSAAFLRFARKILRPGGSLFLSDVHLKTAAELNWRRGVRADGEFQEIHTFNNSVKEILQLCSEAGFIARVHLEPHFDEEERIIFEQNGKTEYFAEISNYPAIYLLHLTKAERRRASVQSQRKTCEIHAMKGGRFTLGANEAVRGTLHIDDSRVESISNAATESSPVSAERSVDLTGYLVLPGLINAHDHLEFALFPRLGRGGYTNFLEWAEDIHRTHAQEIARHRRVPKAVRLWWGGIRNLLCGVTTVCHHNPYDPTVFSNDFVIRVLRDYEWAHSLRLEPDAVLKKVRAPEGQPFFLHLAEGLDKESADEIFELHTAGALDENTIIIHGLGLGPEGSALVRSAGAGLIWCPSSNLFLFDKAMSFGEIRDFRKVAIGSDSPLTACGDLLDEIHCAHQTMHTPAVDAYRFVMKQSARLLRLKNGEGTLRIGAFADLIAVRDLGLTPANTLTAISYRDVELVVVGGRVHLASPEMKRRLPKNASEGLQPFLIEGLVRWVRAPLDWLFKQTFEYLGEPIYLGGRQIGLGT